MLKKLGQKINYHLIILFCSIFFVLFYQNSFWSNLLAHFQTPHQALTLASMGAFLILLFALCLELLCIFHTYRFILFLIIAIASSSAYFMDSLHISINPMIIASLFKTTPREASDFIHLPMILHILLLASIPILSLCIKLPRPQSFGIQTKFIFIVFYLIALIFLWISHGKNITFAFKSYKPLIDMLNPIAPIRSSIRYFSQTWHTPKSYTFVGEDAYRSSNDKPKILILVIGESARAKNFQYNGYERQTNPFTKDLKNLINFSDFSSCGVITAISIPCMLSNLTHQSYTSRNLSLYRDNILDIAKRAQYEVWWISNNGGSCMGEVCKRIEKISYYNRHFDHEMLKEIQSIIKKATQNTFIVVNLHGSHGAKYFERYPKDFEHFMPVCKKEALQECSKEEISNAYDNSLRYSDFVLREMIDALKTTKLQQALWYISDHGESLGEFGQYMHGGLSYSFAPKEQKHIASFIWLGRGFDQYFNAFDAKKDKSINHDVVFHTLLHLLKIQTKDYDAKLDLIQ